MDKPIRVSYDEEGDILEITFGQPEPSVADEVEDGIFVHFSRRTGEVTGVTIMDFEVRAKQSEEAQTLPVSVSDIVSHRTAKTGPDLFSG